MRYHLIALFTVGVWGITFVSTKVLLQAFSPLWILCIRFIIGFVALCILRPHILKLANARHELLFAAAGFTGVAAYYLLENVALVFATATAVGVIVAAAPLFTAILQGILGDRSSLNARFFAGFALAMAGLVIVGAASGGAEAFSVGNGEALLGSVLSLSAALVWAMYSVLVARIADAGYETVASTKRTFLWGLVVIVPVAVIFGGSLPSANVALEPQNLANLAFLGAVASAACFVTWGIAVKRLGAATSTTYIYLVPAITAAASIIILGEPLTLPIVFGILLTIAGLLLSQRCVAGKDHARSFENGL